MFSTDTGETQPAGYRNSSTDFAYGAEFDGTYNWSRQQLYATASTKQYDYQQLPDLNHNEYKVDAGLMWALGSALDGKVDVTRNHSMVPFLDLTQSTRSLSLLTDQTETFQAGLTLNPEWKLEGSAYRSEDTEPSTQSSNEQLTQTSGTTSLEYQGFGPITSGITAGYLTGTYDGFNGQFSSAFRQVTAGLLANYKLARTTFEGQVTYTRRTSDGSGTDNASGLTGSVDFKDQLTPKTSFTLKLDRVINTYYVNLGSEVDTDAGFSLNWQATYKTAVSLGYTFSYRAFPGQAQGVSGAYPVDYQQYGTLSISYQPVRWLTINPYANIMNRQSNTFGRNFDADIYGISLTATIGDSKPPNR